MNWFRSCEQSVIACRCRRALHRLRTVQHLSARLDTACKAAHESERENPDLIQEPDRSLDLCLKVSNWINSESCIVQKHKMFFVEQYLGFGKIDPIYTDS